MLKKMPFVSYKFSDNSTRDIKNFTASIMVDRIKESKDILYKPYTISDSDTPESVSYILYDTPEYWWVLLVINGIVNPFQEWVRESNTIGYGIDRKEHLYFIDIRTNEIQDDIENAKYLKMLEDNQILPEYINQVDRYQYERMVNGNLYNIWAIAPEYIDSFVEEYLHLLGNDYWKMIERENRDDNE